jgi:hypothetical protein
VSALDLVSWATQILFVLLAVASAIYAVRRPRLATLDAALFFGALAVIIVESRIVSHPVASGASETARKQAINCRHPSGRSFLFEQHLISFPPIPAANHLPGMS